MMRQLPALLRTFVKTRPRAAIAVGALLVIGAGYLLLRTPSWVAKVGSLTYSGKVFQEDRTLYFIDLPFAAGESSLAVEAAMKLFLGHWLEERLILTRAADLGMRAGDAQVRAAMNELRGDLSEEMFQLLLVERKITKEVLERKARETVLIAAVLEREVPAPQPVSDAEVEAYFNEHRSDFFKPVQIRALQMTLPTEDDMALVMQSIDDGRSFEQVMAGKRVQGGDMGYFSQGELPVEFDAVLFNLKVGEMSQPVKTPYGFHLFLVVDRQEAHPLQLAEAAGSIRSKLLAQRKAAAEEEWIRKLRGKYALRINRRHPALRGIELGGGLA